MQATIARLSGQLSRAESVTKQLTTDLEGAKEGHTSLTVVCLGILVTVSFLWIHRLLDIAQVLLVVRHKLG